MKKKQETAKKEKTNANKIKTKRKERMKLTFIFAHFFPLSTSISKDKRSLAVISASLLNKTTTNLYHIHAKREKH